jgi:hypothetical protein
MKRFLPFLGMFLGSLCFGLLFIGLFVNATEMDCRRQPDRSYTCEFRTLFFGEYQTFTRSVEGIVGITIADSPASEGSGRVYRAEFVLADGGQTPLNEVWTDREPVARQVQDIGAQLDAGASQIAYRQEPPWWVLYLVGGLTVMAMLFSFMLLGKKPQSTAAARRTPHRMG